jgi:hypothetical protein
MRIGATRLLIAALLLFGTVCMAEAQQFKEQRAKDPGLTWQIMYNVPEVRCPLCDAILDVALRERSPHPTFCRLLDRRPKTFVRPVWTAIDLQPHLDLVKHVIVLHLVGHHPVVERDLGLHGAYPGEVWSQAFWGRYEGMIMPLLEAGDVRLETTLFDLDNDGAPDTLYRITEIVPGDFSQTPIDKFVVDTCDGRTPSTIMFADPDKSPRLAYLFRQVNYEADAEVFRFGATAYVFERRGRSGTIEMVDGGTSGLYYRQFFYGQYED